MDNPPDIKPGDRVRVVLEGEASVADGSSGKCFDIGGTRQGNCILANAEHVVSIEVLAKPAKVGDVIRDPDTTPSLVHSLPVGTVLTTPSGDVQAKHADGEWYFTGRSKPYSVSNMFADRTIVYLPE